MSQDLPIPASAKIDLTLSKYSDIAVPTTPDETTFGYLYKKTASNGLFWLTQGGGEVNLTSAGSGVSSFGTAALFNGSAVDIPNNTRAGSSSLTTVDAAVNSACNTAYGFGTLFSVPDTEDIGAYTAMGYKAGYSVNDGAYSIFIGSSCAPLLTSSNSDIFIGADLGVDITTTNGGNIFIGSGSLTGSNFIGSSNVGIGTSIFGVNPTGASNNVVFGVNAGLTLHDGSNNVLIGAGAGINISDSNTCVAIGSNALGAHVTTVGTVAVGASALLQALNVGNTGLGFQAGSNITTGTNNTIIGYNANVTGNSFSDCIVIGASSRANATSQIRIGFSNVQASVQTSTYIDGIFGKTIDPGSAITTLIDTTGRLGTIASSKRYKYDIQDVSPDVIDRLFEMSPKTFKYKEDPKNTSTYGLIAEDIRDLIPDIVIYSKDADGNRIMDEDGYRVETIQYHLLVPLLVGAVRSLKREIVKLLQE